MPTPLSPGSKVGPYEILSQAGAGGMGVVYKAKDTRLNRFVAVKVLPSGNAPNDERRLRFLQEAQAASALNHPNIVTIYDVGIVDGADYIAMEFVPGKTLDASIRREGMNLAELLRYAVQLTDALTKAHAAGIIHRDLKPGNIMVSVEGQVKILDFGLAKMNDAPLGNGSDETVSVQPKTSEGAIMGTAAYMSPEQAEGKAVDVRSDIFSIGAILYEMATGQRAFRGDTTASTISSVLRDDPKLSTELRPELPAELNRLITRCLRKDPSRRFQNVVDLKVALEELKEESESMRIAGNGVAAAQRKSNARVWIGVAALVVIGVSAFVGWRQWNRVAIPVGPMSVTPLTSYAGAEGAPSFSPDGNQIAFAWSGEKDDNFDIYVKVIGPDPPLRLTTNPDEDFSPTWSPDGRSIAFCRRDAERKTEIILMPALGGAERKLGPVFISNFDHALEWSKDGKWLFCPRLMDSQKVVRIVMLSPTTGEVKEVTHPEGKVSLHGAPTLSPDGRTLAYLASESGGIGTSRIILQGLSESLALEGEARQVGGTDASISGMNWIHEGRELLYWAGNVSSRSSLFRLAIDGNTKPEAVSLPGRNVGPVSFSEQTKRLVYTEFALNANLWRIELANPAKPAVKLISSTMREAFPQYSPDGKKIVFYSNRSGSQQIMVCDADGSGAVQLTQAKALNNATPRWSADGQWITYDSNVSGLFQIYRMSSEGGAAQNVTNDNNPSITASTSRDGKWLYYASQRKGQFDVWKVPSSGGTPQQVTKDSGVAPLESPDGQTLYYIKDRGGLWKQPTAGGPETLVIPRLFRYNFVPTTKGIYYMKRGELGRPSTVEYLDLQSGTIRVITELGLPDLGLDISPDGRYLLYGQREKSTSDLMLAENFR